MKYDKNGILIEKKEEIERMFETSINREVCKENLLIVKKVFDKNKIEFRLVYGTLLGAVRENNFIEGDQDTDLFLFREDRKLVLDCLKELEENGFSLIRCLDNMLSIERKGDYIDLYFFKQNSLADKLFNRVSCGHNFWWIWVSKDYCDKFEEIDFLGAKFRVFKNPVKWLEFTYGKDWKVPKKESADTRTFFSFITKQIGKFIKIFKRS